MAAKRRRYLIAAGVILLAAAVLLGLLTVSRDRPPNVLIISIDTCRADHLGCYGYARDTTPRVDAVAREGILFEHAVTPVPITLPAHSSMLTGTVPLFHRVRDNDNYRLHESNVTLAEILKENGYVTGAVVGSFVLASHTGLQQGFTTYEDDLGEPRVDEERSYYFNERSAEEVTGLAIDWLERHGDGAFFLFLHYFDPHAPYQQHLQYRFTTPVSPVEPAGSWAERTDYLENSLDRYDSEIACVDDAIGEVIDTLKELGVYEKTFLVITSDHGEGFGEHGEVTHSYLIYQSTLRVPLIMKPPGPAAGKRVESLAGIIDVVPTVLGFLDIPVPSIVQGADLRSSFASGEPPSSGRSLSCESLLFTKFGFDPLVGLVDDRWKYIHDAHPELYDLREDPHELHNVALQEEERVRNMRRKLESSLPAGEARSAPEVGPGTEADTRERLQALGYVSTFTMNEEIALDRIDNDRDDLAVCLAFIENLMFHLTRSEYGRARELCTDILSLWPDFEEAHYYLGMTASAENELQTAALHFTRYLELLSREKDRAGERIGPSPRALATAHYTIGSAHVEKNETERAIEHLEQAVRYDPSLRDAVLNLAGLHFRRGDLNSALAQYRRALTFGPDDPVAHYNVGLIYLEKEKYDDAVHHFQEALSLDPDLGLAADRLRYARMQEERREKIVASLLEKIEEHPDQPVLYFRLAHLMHRQDRPGEAVRYLEKALDLDPDAPRVLNLLARLKLNPDLESFDPAGSVVLAQRACELTDYRDPVLLQTLAVARARKGMRREALEAARRALELAQAAGDEALVRSLENLSSSLEGGSGREEP